jgi:hypothetical protein
MNDVLHYSVPTKEDASPLCAVARQVFSDTFARLSPSNGLTFAVRDAQVHDRTQLNRQGPEEIIQRCGNII